MMQDEAAWLRLLMPLLQAAEPDTIVALDGGSRDDSIAVAQSYGAKVYQRPFQFRFDEQANALVDICERLGYTRFLRIDPDEAMFPCDLRALPDQITEDEVVYAFPRWHFWGDRRTVRTGHKWYPDYQFRAWRLGCGIHYPNNQHVHEQPVMKKAYQRLEAHIYHYGWIKPPAERRYRMDLYQSIYAGTQPPDPAQYVGGDYPLASDMVLEPFTGTQPHNPDVIGGRAPFVQRLNLKLTPNLEGDRAVEYGFVEDNMPHGIGIALDIGAAGSVSPSIAAQRHGYNVTAIDVRELNPLPGVTALQGDVRTLSLPKVSLILCVSTIEHIGLDGRYGVTEYDTDGDLIAMRRLRDALTDDGTLILTLPVGRDHVHAPMHRVYGAERLPKLLEGFTCQLETYWVKDATGWREAVPDEALSSYSVSVSQTDWQGCAYALAGFVLRKSC